MPTRTDDPHRKDAAGGAAECLARLAAGDDASAWAWLLLHLGEPMRVAAYRMTGDASLADDAVQEAMLAIRSCAGDFAVRAAPEDPADDQARRWILRVVGNAARMVRRSETRALRRGRAGVAAAGVPGAQGAALERSEAAELLRDAIDTLPERERSAVLLHVIGELGYEQVARELRCPVGTAKTWVHRGLIRLRSHLRRTSDSVLAIATLLPPPALAALPPMLPLPAEGRLGASATSALVPTVVHGVSMATLITIPACVALALGAGVAIRAVAADAVPTTAPSTPQAQPAMAAHQAPGPAPVAAAAGVAPVMDPDVLFTRLDQRIYVQFADSSLKDVSAYLSQVGALPCTADAACADCAVTLSAKSMTMRAVAEWCAALSGTALTYRNGLHFLPADEKSLAATLAQPANVHAVRVSWTKLVDILRWLGLPIIDAAPMAAERWSLNIDADGSAREVLDQVAALNGMRWTTSGGWVVLGSDALGRTSREEAAAIREALGQEIQIQINGDDLSDAAIFLQRVTGQSIVVEPHLSPMPTVTLNARNRRLGSVMGEFARQSGMTLALRSGALVFAKCPSSLLPMRAPSGLDLPVVDQKAPAAPAPARSPVERNRDQF